MIDILLEAASRHIDGLCHRQFFVASATKTYDVPPRRTLLLSDDLQGDSSVVVTNGDNSTVSSADYTLLDPNHSPKWGVRLNKTSNVYWTTNADGDDENVISVAGNYGYSSSAPPPIKAACLEITRRAFNRRRGQQAEGVTSVTAQGVVIEPSDVSSQVMQWIRPYIRLGFG